MEKQTRRSNEFTETMLQMVTQNWLSEKTLILIQEACEWIEINLPSLTDFDEKLKVVQLYTSAKTSELENSNLKLGNDFLEANKLRMESMFEQQKELLENQSNLISRLDKSNSDQNERIKELQFLLQTPPPIVLN